MSWLCKSFSGIPRRFDNSAIQRSDLLKVSKILRFQLHIHIFQTKEELMQARRELVASPKSPKTSLAAQAILRRVENERDDAIADLHRLSTERDSLRERIKVSFSLSSSFYIASLAVYSL